ncbi:small acid-soluble spore protein Tlp [Bacillus pseudomycoides]|uniref:Small, acid-soluble spore protein Tlp n=1 Tax=Bacillus pseudomycoides TaxID=64104 RepID=A0AA91VB97_9BACI|nr:MULTISPECIES: small acid-soluble spore protein Tlp [Bacillus]PEB56818.1 small acid-soluble spore protein Tlp [Bacillus sp. AFS098217]PED82066.1 small acid-soluble spore protein Tlp [Bacillus pseudomycoides]PEU06538.1 small acid-soluble spore protein Tlp [Bacillus sp. AFS019443]PEU18490.1 small acid-soluble spore protein Tlp [Bacillus sp. AFS014408]PFW62852.1 small acid-soluble spore protein Tlp [Bacillus sp. AFS075034]
MAEQYKANPDDRSDNVEKLQEMVQNTIDNFNEAKETAEVSNEQDRAAIEAKNQRRLESIDSLKSEIKDESEYNG